MPKVRRLSHAEEQDIRGLSFRQAKARYHVSYEVWKRAKQRAGVLPYARQPDDPSLEERVLQSVREMPHLNTAERASRLGCSASTAQKVLERRGLSKLNARLTHAGYHVEPVRPLEVARSRRIVASHPGALTHTDFKTFGYLRGRPKPGTAKESVRIGGFVVVDSLTAFATCHVCEVDDQFEASAAIRAYVEKAPFDVQGILLTDNAKCFLSKHFMSAAHDLGFILRTIRTGQPWSNGKVEALNRTLKYQCFSAIAGNIGDWDQMLRLVDTWMSYYNGQRAHHGHVNKGLPPLAWLDLYNRCEGSHLDKLLQMGVLKDDPNWKVRLMGGGSGKTGKLPYAFIMDRTNRSGKVSPPAPAIGRPKAPPQEDDPPGQSQFQFAR